MEHRSTLKAAKELAGSHLIASCAAFAALFLFIPTGQHIVAAALDGSLSTGIDRTSAIAFLLNIAVILFAWRRSKDLQQRLAANEAATIRPRQCLHRSRNGLANRRELMRVLAETSASQKSGSKLLLLDLDFFKKVNDLYGHVVGDEVLKRVADIIQRAVAQGSCCARLGGDEFAVLVPTHPDEVVSQSVAKIIRAIAEPLVLENGYGARFGLRRYFAHRSRNERRRVPAQIRYRDVCGQARRPQLPGLVRRADGTGAARPDAAWKTKSAAASTQASLFPIISRKSILAPASSRASRCSRDGSSPSQGPA